MALAASTNNVLWLAESSTLPIADIGVEIAVALGATRVLRSVLYGVMPDDPVLYATAAAALFAVAVVASYLPARRVTALDPASALRAE